MRLVRIAARHSDLARLQAYRVADSLKTNDPSLTVEFNFRASLGDQNLDDPLWKMPERGVFTEDFIGDLTGDRADLIVHSWKDLPTETRISTTIAATLPRADVRDLFLLREDRLRELLAGSGNAPVSVGAERRSGAGARGRPLRVLTSSPRRAYNLEPFFKKFLPFDCPSVEFQNVRGNIPTRLRKLMEGQDGVESDGLIVAKAALDRLLMAPEAEFSSVQKAIREVLGKCRWMVLPLTINPTAAAQGALAIEIHRSRKDLKKTLQAVHHKPTFDDVQLERRILASYGGGCHQKIGVTCLSRPYGQILFLRGLTDRGESLNSVRLNQTRGERPEFTASQLWPPPHARQTFYQRAPRALSAAENEALHGAGALWVSRESAWPAGYRPPPGACVWSAGLKTWESLAQKGVWVCGSAEGLGENEDPRIDALLGVAPVWLRLSHDQSDDLRGRAADRGIVAAGSLTRRAMRTLSTYRLIPVDVPAEEIAKLKAAKAFFWSSISQYERALELCPEIKAPDCRHACGPGATADNLRAQLLKVDIYLSYEDWRSDLEPAAR